MVVRAVDTTRVSRAAISEPMPVRATTQRVVVRVESTRVSRRYAGQSCSGHSYRSGPSPRFIAPALVEWRNLVVQLGVSPPDRATRCRGGRPSGTVTRAVARSRHARVPRAPGRDCGADQHDRGPEQRGAADVAACRPAVRPSPRLSGSVATRSTRPQQRPRPPGHPGPDAPAAQRGGEDDADRQASRRRAGPAGASDSARRHGRGPGVRRAPPPPAARRVAAARGRGGCVTWVSSPARPQTPRRGRRRPSRHRRPDPGAR